MSYYTSKGGPDDPTLTPTSIRALRKSLGMSQQGFAEYLGVSLSSVRFWESGRHEPSGLYRDKIVDLVQSPPTDGRRRRSA